MNEVRCTPSELREAGKVAIYHEYCLEEGLRLVLLRGVKLPDHINEVKPFFVCYQSSLDIVVRWRVVLLYFKVGRLGPLWSCLATRRLTLALQNRPEILLVNLKDPVLPRLHPALIHHSCCVT